MRLLSWQQAGWEWTKLGFLTGSLGLSMASQLQIGAPSLCCAKLLCQNDVAPCDHKSLSTPRYISCARMVCSFTCWQKHQQQRNHISCMLHSRWVRVSAGVAREWSWLVTASGCCNASIIYSKSRLQLSAVLSAKHACIAPEFLNEIPWRVMRPMPVHLPASQHNLRRTCWQVSALS